MNAGDVLVYIRDAVYAAILAKKTAATFINNNDFDLQRTWRPWTSLEELNKTLTSGRVYVLGAHLGDLTNLSRSNMAQAELPITVGFQHALADVDNYSTIDTHVKFTGELADVCRLLVDGNNEAFSFSRIEFLRDPDNLPLSFMMLRKADVYESYFTAYYTLPLGGYEWLTTTTTT